MKCLTVCQPYASYFFAEHLPAGIERKRVENRTWECNHRGPLLIHSGAGKQWLKNVPHADVPEWMPFGAILGIVDVVDCVQLRIGGDPYFHQIMQLVPYPWLATHQHACGPWCIVVENPRRFSEPIYCKGFQGLWNVADDMVAEQIAKAVPCG